MALNGGEGGKAWMEGSFLPPYLFPFYACKAGEVLEPPDYIIEGIFCSLDKISGEI